MTRLDDIRERMDKALIRLEGAVDTQAEKAAELGATAERNDTLAGEVETLKQECARLQGELNSIRTQHGSLRQTTDTVSSRLDNAIAQLRTVLDG